MAPSSRTIPTHPSRRHWLGSIGAMGAASLGLDRIAIADLLDRDRRRESAMTAKAPDFPARCQSVIFLFMVGGPSQVDSFDYKPLLQELDGKPVPESIRKAVSETKHANVFHGCHDKLMASPYRFSRHGQQGMWISELFPHTANVVDDLCFLHSVQADSNNHAPASYQLHTGDIRSGKASLGSWVTYGLGSVNEDLPGYVTLFDAGPLGGAANYTNGFLPPSYQPVRLRTQGPPVFDLLPPTHWESSQRASIDLIQKWNEEHASRIGPYGELEARIASYELAYRMQSSAMDVGKLDDEPSYIQSEYGIDQSDKRLQSFARKCLMARRLVERGVRFVQVYDMPDKDGWDAHAKLTDNHTPRARWTDQPSAALIRDLKRRGLLDQTLVIWASEFGRTPMMQGDRGRQHNAAGFTIWMAGGGMRPGMRYGSTDEIGLMANEHPISFRDLHATILTALGIEYEKLSFTVSGRQERITGVAGTARPIREILL
ncbi:MAG: DUF1501 domain-containing protein [Pirellulales bacterium]